MSFLQPAILFALPVIALPIVIHLINQRRFQTVHWGAMSFLLAANRLSRGYARIRQWLILAARTLAIAGLIFAVSRPLSSGWLGVAGGGQVDTTIILVDRSPSMSQIGQGGESKLQAGMRQLANSLKPLPSSRYVLIDSGTNVATEIESPELLTDMPETTAISESADLPKMLEVAEEYIRANRPSRCEVWICSDVRRSDWKDESGRWDALRSSLAELPQMIRYHLLAYPQVAPQNRSIRATRVRRVDGPDGAQLLISLRVEQSATSDEPVAIPIQLEIDGGRSEFTAQLSGSVLELRDHAIPIEGGRDFGWGRLSIPSDASPADNEFYFVYDREPERRTILVSERGDAVRPFEFAASVSADPLISCSVANLAAEQLTVDELNEAALLIWQQVIPETSDPAFALLEQFAARGGRILFLPPLSPTDATFSGVGWGTWNETGENRIATWVGDRDLLANTRSGEALPLGDLDIARNCSLQGEFTTLATLDGGAPMLARAMGVGGNVYFCATTAESGDSSLAAGGVVLYAMLHRAIEAGAQSLGNASQFVAGAVPVENDGQWSQLSGNRDALSSQYAKHAGVYRNAEGRIFAINRSESEDLGVIVPDPRVSSLFTGLDFSRVDDEIGSGSALIQEIWRLFLISMLIALLAEAALCLPRRAAKKTGMQVAGAAT